MVDCRKARPSFLSIFDSGYRTPVNPLNRPACPAYRVMVMIGCCKFIPIFSFIKIYSLDDVVFFK